MSTSHSTTVSFVTRLQHQSSLPFRKEMRRCKRCGFVQRVLRARHSLCWITTAMLVVVLTTRPATATRDRHARMARTEASAASASFSSSSNTLSAEQESKRLFGQVSALSRGDSSGMKTCPTEPMGALMDLKQTPDTALLERSLVRGYMYGAGCALKSATTNVAPCACAMPWVFLCFASLSFLGFIGIGYR